MRITLLWMLAVTTTCFSLPSPDYLQQQKVTNTYTHYASIMEEIRSFISEKFSPKKPVDEISAINDMLQRESSTLNAPVIHKVLTTLKCSLEYNINNNNILTIIDYSLPSSEKRLWVFDLKQKKLLFHTYVSHGIKSGTLLSNNFSNKYNSKASSIGVYKTDKTYYGRDGLSLRLDGLDRGFNDNASNRSVVMHGSWYVNESFIKKYGRAGRSWGCPALPLNLTEPIINTIKDNSLFVIYYPSDSWFLKSKFLNCDAPSPAQNVAMANDLQPSLGDGELRDDVLLTQLKTGKKHSENEAVVVMSANNYATIFHTKAPLSRMLRRQINNIEYIALSTREFNTITANPDNKLNTNQLDTVYFVIPVIKMVRGYYATEMQIVDMGKIKEVLSNAHSSKTNEQSTSYTVLFETKPLITLKSTNHFIRWLGL